MANYVSKQAAKVLNESIKYVRMNQSSYLGVSSLFILTWLGLEPMGLSHLDYQLCNTPPNHALALLIK